MTIRYYSSLDDGAPLLPAVSSQRFIDNLRIVLINCLVTGYASKPGAGWTLAHDHPDGFTLSNGEGYINFVSVNSSTVAIYLLEALTDTSKAEVQGYNRRSGLWSEGSGVAQRHYHYAQGFNGTSDSKGWCVIADSTTVTLQWLGGSTLVDASYRNGAALHFGRYWPAIGGSGLCALGGSHGISGDPRLSSMPSGTTLRHPFEGIPAQGEPSYRAGLFAELPLSAQESLISLSGLPVLRPSHVALVGYGAALSGSTSGSSGRHCGRLRGLLCEPSLSAAYVSKVLPLLGVARPTWQDKLRPLTLPDGRRWVPLYPHVYDLGCFVSLDPADWE